MVQLRRLGVAPALVLPCTAKKKTTVSSQRLPRRGGRVKGAIVQACLRNPLLLDGSKCEFRVYVLVAGDPHGLTRAFLYPEGTARRNIEAWVDGDYDNIYRHVTNVDAQKHHPAMADSKFKENLKWSWDKVDAYLVGKGLTTEPSWTRSVMVPWLQNVAVPQIFFEAAEGHIQVPCVLLS